MDETTTTLTAPEPTVDATAQDDAVRIGERVTPDVPAVDEAPLEPQAAEPQPTEPEHSPDYEQGFEAALEQLAEYDRYEAELRQREEMYERVGEQVGLTGPEVQRLAEEQARQQILAAQQQQVESAEVRQRMAEIHQQRRDLLDGAFVELEAGLGTFDRDDVLAMVRQFVAENPGYAAEAGPRWMEGLLHAAAEASAQQIADGNTRVDELIARANRHFGADPDEVRLAADRAFDPEAPDQGAEIARAIFEGFNANPTPVRLGTRVVDRYAAVKQLHDELADPTPPPRQERRVQLRDGAQLRGSDGRFISAISAERVTDRYRREAAEAEQEQRRLAAHKERMKGLI